MGCRFFFSSRRRHTRSKRDWSSDVCSSDLVSAGEVVGFLLGYQPPQRPGSVFVWQVAVRADQRGRRLAARMLDDLVDALPGVHTLEATVTEDNTASRRLFASFARGRGAELTWSEGVPATDFPDGHDGEPRLHISPLTRS